MRNLRNLAIILASGILALLGSCVLTFAVLVALSRGPASDSEVGILFITVMLWPLHGFLAIGAMVATFVWRKSREERRADEALAGAFRKAEDNLPPRAPLDGARRDVK